MKKCINKSCKEYDITEDNNCEAFYNVTDNECGIYLEATCKYTYNNTHDTFDSECMLILDLVTDISDWKCCPCGKTIEIIGQSPILGLEG